MLQNTTIVLDSAAPALTTYLTALILRQQPWKARSATNLGLKPFLDGFVALQLCFTVLGISALENHIFLERCLKIFHQRHTVMSRYEQESFSFGTAELNNERHRSLCPPVLHHTLGQTASVGTTAYDHHSEEQRPLETAAPTAATWN